MKILLAVVMTLSVASSVWAACGTDAPKECLDQKACEDAKLTWKHLGGSEKDECVKVGDVKTPASHEVCTNKDDKPRNAKVVAPVAKPVVPQESARGNM